MKDVIIFIDLSSTDTGLTILFDDDKTLTYSLKVNEFKDIKDKNERARLKIKDLSEKMDAVLVNLNILHVVIESPFVNKRFLNSSEILLKMHGFILHKYKDITFSYFSPSTIKRVVAHNGKATKEQVIKSIQDLGIILKDETGNTENDNMYDSYALMITYNHYKKINDGKLVKTSY